MPVWQCSCITVIARVLLPYTSATGCYRLTQPIRIFSGTLDFGSDPHSNVWGYHTRLCPEFRRACAGSGSAGRQQSSLMRSSLVTGTGNSFNTGSGGSGSAEIVLSDWLNSALVNFNANTQFGVEMVVNLSAIWLDW